jgi:exopolysaccharide biosynthesis polyprenyl glycosylphosphotransferase
MTSGCDEHDHLVKYHAEGMVGIKMGAREKSGNLLDISIEQKSVIPKRLTFKWLEWRVLILVLILSDLILYNLAFRVAYWVRYESNWPITKYWIQPAIDYSELSLLTIPVLLAIFAMIGLYRRSNLLGGTREYSMVFTATTIAMFVNICVGFLFPDDLILARGWVILTWLFSFISISTGRFLIRRVVYRLRLTGLFQNSALIVGSNTEASLVANQLLNTKSGGLKVIGFIRCGNCTSEIQENISCLGHLEDLHDVIRKHRTSVIILISSALSRDQVLEIFRKYGTSKDIDLRMSTGLYEIITTGLQVKEDGMVPLVAINNVRLTGSDQVLKYILDYCIAIPIAIVLIPFFLIIAILIKLDSSGPVFYLRRVMGVNGKQFDAYKFRTMCTNGDQILTTHPELMEEYKNSFKIKDDPRVTRLGKFLRKTSIDELPQIFNVLKNEMSLVGPRMICPEELEKYNQWDINLLTVKPGLTGLWQVRGRSDVSYEERVRFDMFYIRNWTIWMDLQIILQTIPSVIFRRGAY